MSGNNSICLCSQKEKKDNRRSFDSTGSKQEMRNCFRCSANHLFTDLLFPSSHRYPKLSKSFLGQGQGQGLPQIIELLDRGIYPRHACRFVACTRPRPPMVDQVQSLKISDLRCRSIYFVTVRHLGRRRRLTYVLYCCLL